MNAPEERQFSPEFVGKIRDTIGVTLSKAREEKRPLVDAVDQVVEALKPIFASVDQNAHMRGGRLVENRVREALGYKPLGGPHVP